jgi:ion channel
VPFVWPVFSRLLVNQMVFGFIAGLKGPWGDSLYFTFVTGLTIGYSDFVPCKVVGRFVSILIGIDGILLTGLVAAVGVKALNAAAKIDRSKPHDR